MMLSIVIPVYNSERYLRECLDSVRRQTFGDFEVICVNDGSTDGSAAILEEYANRDLRVKIMEQKNAGASAARNVGLSVATGKYVYFLDSDDWIVDDAMERCIAICERDNLDQLIFNSECLYADPSTDLECLKRKAKSYQVPPELADRVFSGGEALEKARQMKYFCVCPPFRVFRLETLRRAGIRFPVGIIHEDDFFIPISICEASRVEMITDVLYVRRFRPASVSTSSGKTAEVRSLRSFLVVYLLMEREFAERNYAKRFPSLASKYFVRERNRIIKYATPRTTVAVFMELSRHMKGRDLVRGRMLLVKCAIRRVVRRMRRRPCQKKNR